MNPPDPASAPPPMVPSARERLQPYYPRVRPSEAEELQERAYRDGWNAALAALAARDAALNEDAADATPPTAAPR